MILEITYNLAFIISLIIGIISLTFYLKNICKCFAKHFLGSIILVSGLGLSFIIPLAISRELIQSKIIDLELKLKNPPYQIFIFPKSYPFENQVKIIFKTKNRYFSIILENNSFDVEDIKNQILLIKPQIDKILEE